MDENFGGIDIGLWGDFLHFLPVRARALFNNVLDLKSLQDKRGQQLCKLFDKTVELDVLIREQGPAQEAFLTCLDGLRNNAFTIIDWTLLSGRVQAKLPHDVVATFEDTLRLYGTKASANDFNHVKVRDLNVSVEQIKAHYIGTDAEKAS